MQPTLASAVDLARAALVDLDEGVVGAHLGVRAEDEFSATHRFAAELPGYRGWEWVAVVATVPGSDRVTVSELALLPGADALTAPEWLPWDERVRPGDLGPGDLLPPAPQDPRLVPGYVANGDPVVDEMAREVGLGRKQVMSLDGRLDAAQRWYGGAHGPESDMARSAPSICALCGFYLPLAGSLRTAFGVCGNEMAADGQVVYAEYGCGAHSDTMLPHGAGSPAFAPYDDGALEEVVLPAPAEVEAAITEEAVTEEAAVESPEGDEAPEVTETSDTAEASESTQSAE
nr:DUF3027 domain-containing protein [Rhodococcus sp. D2-41]